MSGPVAGVLANPPEKSVANPPKKSGCGAKVICPTRVFYNGAQGVHHRFGCCLDLGEAGCPCGVVSGDRMQVRLVFAGHRTPVPDIVEPRRRGSGGGAGASAGGGSPQRCERKETRRNFFEIFRETLVGQGFGVRINAVSRHHGGRMFEVECRHGSCPPVYSDPILVLSKPARVVKVHFSITDTVADLKQKIELTFRGVRIKTELPLPFIPEDLVGLPAGDQQLMFGGRELSNEDQPFLTTAARNRIRMNSTIHCTLPKLGNAMVEVRHSDENARIKAAAAGRAVPGEKESHMAGAEALVAMGVAPKFPKAPSQGSGTSNISSAASDISSTGSEQERQMGLAGKSDSAPHRDLSSWSGRLNPGGHTAVLHPSGAATTRPAGSPVAAASTLNPELMLRRMIAQQEQSMSAEWPAGVAEHLMTENKALRACNQQQEEEIRRLRDTLHRLGMDSGSNEGQMASGDTSGKKRKVAGGAGGAGGMATSAPPVSYASAGGAGLAELAMLNSQLTQSGSLSSGARGIGGRPPANTPGEFISPIQRTRSLDPAIMKQHQFQLQLQQQHMLLQQLQQQQRGVTTQSSLKGGAIHTAGIQRPAKTPSAQGGGGGVGPLLQQHRILADAAAAIMVQQQMQQAQAQSNHMVSFLPCIFAISAVAADAYC